MLLHSRTPSPLPPCPAQATVEHACSLATFAASYKLALLLLARGAPATPGAPEQPWHAVVAGSAAGWLAFGRRITSVKSQVTLYVLSRVLVGMCKALAKQDVCRASPLPALVRSPAASACATALVWGLAMLLWECDDVLSPSLTRTMDTIYRDGDAPAQHSPALRGLLPTPPFVAALVAFALVWQRSDLDGAPFPPLATPQ